MKKIFLLLISLLLVSCSAESNAETELNEFIEVYNENAEIVNLPKITDETIQDHEEENNMYWQRLVGVISDNSTYELQVKYDNDKNLIGYNISIKGQKDYEYLTGTGIEFSTVIAKTLGLNTEMYEENLNIALDEDINHEYKDEQYTISFIGLGVHDAGMLVIDFSKE